jgi:hypothetical protein
MRRGMTMVKLAAAVALGLGALTTNLPVLSGTAHAGPPAYTGCVLPYRPYGGGASAQDCHSMGDYGIEWGWWRTYYCYEIMPHDVNLCYLT